MGYATYIDISDRQYQEITEAGEPRRRENTGTGSLAAEAANRREAPGIRQSRRRISKNGKRQERNGKKGMYKRAVSLLTLGSCVIFVAVLCAKGVNAAWLPTQPVYQLKLELKEIEEKAKGRQEVCEQGSMGIGIADRAVSEQRVVDYAVMEQQPLYQFSDEELEVLLRIVEAEAGGEDEDGRLLVANVVLNRVNSEEFPDTVTEVVFQKEGDVAQFSPAYSGKYNRVEISDTTISAVGRALMGEDISQGALYFVARKRADRGSLRWFDEKLIFLFEHGGHEFFK